MPELQAAVFRAFVDRDAAAARKCDQLFQLFKHGHCHHRGRLGGNQFARPVVVEIEKGGLRGAGRQIRTYKRHLEVVVGQEVRVVAAVATIP